MSKICKHINDRQKNEKYHLNNEKKFNLTYNKKKENIISHLPGKSQSLTTHSVDKAWEKTFSYVTGGITKSNKITFVFSF